MQIGENCTIHIFLLQEAEVGAAGEAGKFHTKLPQVDDIEQRFVPDDDHLLNFHVTL